MGPSVGPSRHRAVAGSDRPNTAPAASRSPFRQIAIVSLLLFSSLACTPRSKEAAGPVAEAGVVVVTAEQVARAGLSTAVVQERKSSDTLRLPGTLEVDPRRSWRVSPVVEGVVEDVGAMAHDVVRKGQVLARLRSTALGELQVAWLEARAGLRLANADRERNLVLRKDGVVSESQWLRVDTEFQRAQGVLAQVDRKLSLAGMSPRQIEALEAVDRRLGEMTLNSPADGVVLASTVSRGQALGAGQEAFQIADLSTLWVTVHIPVASLGQLRPGAKATARVSGSPRDGWDGKLGSLGGKVDAGGQTVEGRVVVTNHGSFLRPGMYAEVEVVGNPVQSLMVPSAGLFTVGNQAYVFQKLGTTRYRPLAVIAGPPLGDWTPISGPGAEAGVEVVVRGLAELKSHWLYNRGE